MRPGPDLRPRLERRESLARLSGGRSLVAVARVEARGGHLLLDGVVVLVGLLLVRVVWLDLGLLCMRLLLLLLRLLLRWLMVLLAGQAMLLLRHWGRLLAGLLLLRVVVDLGRLRWLLLRGRELRLLRLWLARRRLRLGHLRHLLLVLVVHDGDGRAAGGARGEVLRRIHYGRHRTDRPDQAAPLFGLPLSCLNSLLFHGHRPGHVVQLEVESARVADWIAAIVAPPQGGGLRLTVAAAQVLSSRSRHALLGPRLGSVGAVRLDVEAAGVADIVAVHVAAP